MIAPYQFARALADDIAVMDRGEIVLSGAKNYLPEPDVRKYLPV